MPKVYSQTAVKRFTYIYDFSSKCILLQPQKLQGKNKIPFPDVFNVSRTTVLFIFLLRIALEKQSECKAPRQQYLPFKRYSFNIQEKKGLWGKRIKELGFLA